MIYSLIKLPRLIGLLKEDKQKEFFKKALDYASSRNGKCLSIEYLTAKTKMRWKCDKPDHDEWESSYDSIVLKGAWCNRCAIEKNANKCRDSNGLIKAHEHAKKNGGQCLSTEYINARTHMTWKCSNSEHKSWSAIFNQVVKHKKWCSACKKEDK